MARGEKLKQPHYHETPFFMFSAKRNRFKKANGLGLIKELVINQHTHYIFTKMACQEKLFISY